ncbi:MAG: carbonic anhydrase [Eubacteriales bacterium]|nr:carbonic anhydrase [Eubacteriales bacterium]
MPVSYQQTKQFKHTYFKEHEQLYRELARAQAPHTLFITCSDSRIAPMSLLSAKPGDVFILRNVANIVPVYDADADHCGTLSAIEYAALVLKVKEIVICGHSNCGGCAACLHDDGHLDDYANIKHWIHLIDDVKERTLAYAEASGCNEHEKEVFMEKENVKQQILNLMTHPQIRERMDSGELVVEGWYYDIASGRIDIYSPEMDDFIREDE